DQAFATMAERNVAAILYGAVVFFQVIGERLVCLAARYRIPALYEWREFVTASGLMSYNTDRKNLGGKQETMPGAYSRARSRPTSRLFSHRASSSSSISRQQRNWASRCRRRCSPAPTR